MSIETVSLIIAAFVSGSLGIAAAMRNPRSPLCLSFALFCGLLFAHDALSVLEGFSRGGTWGSPRLHSLVAVLLGPSVVLLFREIAFGSQRHLPRVAVLYLPLVGIVALLNLKEFESIHPWVYVMSHVLFVVAAIIVVTMLARAEKAAGFTREKMRLRYALWGAVITVAFFVTDALYFAGFEVPPLGTLARIVYVLFLFQTFIQKELVTAQEVVEKLALFGGIALMLSLIYFLLVSWVGNRSGLFFFNTLIASFVIIVLFDPIRKLTSRFTRRLLLRRSTMLEDALGTLSEDLRGVLEPAELARRIGSTLHRHLGIEAPSLFQLDSDGLIFVEAGAKSTAVFPREIDASSPFIEYMSLRRGRPFVLETIETDMESFYSSQPKRFLTDCLAVMRRLDVDFVVPLLHETKVMGFLAARAGERIIFSNEQLRLFIPLSRQVGLQLRNAQVFTELRNRERLATAGEMAAGLAHEIKNPLGAIKGAAQLLRDGKAEDGSSEEFLEIIIDETNRLSAVLTEFLEYAKPRRDLPSLRCEPLRVVEHTVAVARQGTGVPIDILAYAPPPAIEADPEVLKQVLLNLIRNALDSVEGHSDAPRVCVRIREIKAPEPWFEVEKSLPLFKIWEGWGKQSAESPSPFVEISIEDNGVGLRPEDVPRIFVPFYTTKPKGTGLGLAICQRLVENMGGSIHVRPNHPRGAIFSVHLPTRRGRVRESAEENRPKPKELSV